jgi:hypothetical protein
MRAAAIDIVAVVVRFHASARVGVRHAHGEFPVFIRDPFGARVSSKITVKGTVFLHDDDDVFDFVNANRAVVVPIILAIPAVLIDAIGPGSNEKTSGYDRYKHGYAHDPKKETGEGFLAHANLQ